MSNYNKIILSGKIFKEPENHNGVVKFTLINEDGFGDNKNTYWIKCVAFKKTAEFINKYMHAGMNVILDGKLTIRKYEEKFYTEVIINNIQFNESKGQKKQQPENNDDEDSLF